MGLYVILASLTETGAKNLTTMMQKRSSSLTALQDHGIKIVADYALMGGSYDFLYIVEAEDNETILRQVVSDTRHGDLKFHTMPALPLDTFEKLVQKF
jgi:uncharacterized protein with GYD domain